MEDSITLTSKRLSLSQGKHPLKKWISSIQMMMSQYNSKLIPNSTNSRLTSSKTIINKIRNTTTTINNSTITVNNNMTTASSSNMTNLHRYTRLDLRHLQLLMLSKLSLKKITVTNKRHQRNNQL
jgi:hypothetical protein